MTTPQPLSPRQQRRVNKAQAKAARPWVLRHWLLTGVAAAIVIVIIAVAAGGSSKKSTTTSSKSSDGTVSGPLQHASDYVVTACKNVSEFGSVTPEAIVKITNTSSKTSNYLGTLAFESKDGKTQYDTEPLVASDLAAGQTTSVTVNDLTAAPAGYVCKVVDTTRLSANN